MKNIWIWNHYATGMFFDRGGRHYCFAKYLFNLGYFPTIFCANTVHNRSEIVEVNSGVYKKNSVDEIPFLFVRTSAYKGNGFSRIRNMLLFSINVMRTATLYYKENKPDVILASSVHPFTCVAGLLMAKKLGVPCVVEIRDLWPISIVEFNGTSKNNPVIWALYRIEKWIYKKADKLIFTMAGGADYIRDRGWDKQIDMDKIYHINNGVDLEEFDNNAEVHQIKDIDLDDCNSFKIIYAGSIRTVNNLWPAIKAAKILRESVGDSVKLILYGNGDCVDDLKSFSKENNLSNIILKGFVEKKYIPSILKRANVTLLNYEQVSLMRYGSSPNKLFDYFSAGRPILQTFEEKYDLIKEHNCGVTVRQTAEDIAEGILHIKNLSAEETEILGSNARALAEEYDYKRLSKKLEHVLLVAVKEETK